ncbi:MAG: AAA family ATPase [Spirochaetales bacterium]|nr:AAA family ATPase [Spirochaetales bacterium]
MRDIKRIYVGATRQNDGKTITALGLLDAISEIFPHVGYIKPVGQQFKLIGDKKIDKDATLMNEVFHIGNQLPDMSPVAVPQGFTKDYILHGNAKRLEKIIINAYERSSEGKDFMVIEGTGHAGVGSVFDLSNAAVAKLLGAKVIIVTCAGIGRPIDEVMLNKAVFDAIGVKVLGVVVNKVKPAKYEAIDKYVRLGFKRKGIDVLGVVPYFPVLSSPTIRQLHEDIKGELISGENNLDQSVSKIIVGAMPAHTALDYFRGDVLLITPGNREDLLLAAITCNFPGIHTYSVKGIILTCGVWPNKTILKLVRHTDIPIILVPDDTFTTAQKITNLIIKIRPKDFDKINKVKEVVKEYIDINAIIKKLDDK